MTISISSDQNITDASEIRRLYTATGKPGRNQSLPIHRWFRFPAGFAADFIDGILKEFDEEINEKPLLDPFGGIATSLICASKNGFNSLGVEAHPLFHRLGKTKLRWDLSSYSLRYAIEEFTTQISGCKDSYPDFYTYPSLVRRCFPDETTEQLSNAVNSLKHMSKNSDDAVIDFLWLGLVAVIRKVSHVCTSPWQYVLPNRMVANHKELIACLSEQYNQMLNDLSHFGEGNIKLGKAKFVHGDARDLSFIPDHSIGITICSPPYLNNFDYSDATRLELYVLRDASSWADITQNIRSKLIISATTQVKRTGFDPEAIVEGIPHNIRHFLLDTMKQLTTIRNNKGGKKSYDIVVGQYFNDMSKVLKEIARVLEKGKLFIMMVGDSAPYGVHVPTDKWLAEIAIEFGFSEYQLIKLRDRNNRWDNRKHKVPLRESLVLLRR